MKTASVARLKHESSLPDVFASQAGVKRSEVHSRPQSPSFLGHVVGKRGAATSGRKNVMSMRELFCPDPLAGFEKMAEFQIFYCLKIKCFHS